MNVLMQSVLLVIKDAWRYCKEDKISLGVSLVATVKDDKDDEGNDMQSRLVGIIATLLPGNFPGGSCKVADGRGLYCLSTHRTSIRLH